MRAALESVNWQSGFVAAPSRQVGLASAKGSISIGGDADIVIWNPEREFLVAPEAIQHRHKLTSYVGETLRGVVEKTFLRGQMVYDGREFGEPKGQNVVAGQEIKNSLCVFGFP